MSPTPRSTALLQGVAAGAGLAAIVLGVLALEGPSDFSVRVRAGTAQPFVTSPSEPARWTLTAGIVGVPPMVVAEPVPPAPLPPIALRIVEPTVITDGQFYAALYRSPWDERYWSRLLEIARCESSMDAGALGDGGLAVGLLQLRLDAHPHLARSLDFTDVNDALVASYIVFLEAGRSLRPWACS